MLKDYAEKNGFTGIRHFTDDGISGTTFDREGLRAMLAEVEKGNIGTIIVKDMSRLGRNYVKESQALKGIAKMKYDKEHKASLEKYPEIRERMQSLLEQGEKITPKQWKEEIQSLQAEYDSIRKEQSKTATELAYAEVISYNKKNLERASE